MGTKAEEKDLAEGAGMAATVGVVSDTHGLVRPELLAHLRGVDLILHAGDIGGIEVLQALREIAPVRAVRGNVDRAEWAADLPENLIVPVAGLRFFLLHDIHQLVGDPGRAGFDAIVSGHSHTPVVGKRGRVLIVNPGSAGPRRFHLPVSMARIRVRDGVAEAELVRLLDDDV